MLRFDLSIESYSFKCVTLNRLEKGLFHLDISNFYIVFLQSILIAEQ